MIMKKNLQSGSHCISCGATMTSGREKYRYVESGLPNVTLVNVEILRCPKCGEFELVIPKMAQLHRFIAGVLANKTERLTNHEVRFLRKHIGWSGVDFARSFGVTPETVSRWESGAQSMNSMAERLLRILSMDREPIRDYSILEKLGSESPRKPRPIHVAMEREWALAA